MMKGILVAILVVALTLSGCATVSEKELAAAVRSVLMPFSRNVNGGETPTTAKASQQPGDEQVAKQP